MHDFLKTVGKIAFGVLFLVFVLFRPQLNNLYQRIVNPQEIKSPEQFLEKLKQP